MKKSAANNRFPMIAALTYFLLALAWIFLSDRLLSVFADVTSIVWLSTAKGTFFAVVSAAGFYFALRAAPTAKSSDRNSMLEKLAAGFNSDRQPPWLTYSFSFAITLATLILRESIAVPYESRPMILMFMFPIITSSMLGGLYPGLLATTLAILCVIFMIFQHVHSLNLISSYDLLQMAFLIINGVVVSLLSETLLRLLTREKANRRLLDTIISGTSDAVFVKDLLGKYLLVNEAAAQFAGKAREEIIGRDDNELFPESSAKVLQKIDHDVIVSRSNITHDERITTHEGRELGFLVTKGPIFDNSGQVVGLFGISRDISERMLAEREILRLNTELEQRVSERTAELYAANVELEELAYALTHNLRAPLRAINGFTHMLEDEFGGAVNENETSLCINHLRNANNNIVQMIEGILLLLRCTQGQLHREKVNMTLLATEKLTKLKQNDPDRQITYSVEPDIHGIGDATMLKAALDQLIENAWKFTIATPAAHIRFYTENSSGKKNTYCISDNGAGFDMRYSEKLFKPFQRLHRLDEFPGVGIGLALVQRIINRHGGSISAEAAVGRGAVFRFTLN